MALYGDCCVRGTAVLRRRDRHHRHQRLSARPLPRRLRRGQRVDHGQPQPGLASWKHTPRSWVTQLGPAKVLGIQAAITFASVFLMVFLQLYGKRTRQWQSRIVCSLGRESRPHQRALATATVLAFSQPKSLHSGHSGVHRAVSICCFSESQ